MASAPLSHNHHDHGHTHGHDHGHTHSHGPHGHGHTHNPRAVAPRPRWSRRMFVQEFGRRTFAVAILGTGVVTVGCSSESDGSATGTAAPDPTATAVPPTDVPSTNVSATEVPPTSVPATSVPAEEIDDEQQAAENPATGDLMWQQVSLGFVSAYVLARGNEFAVVDTGVGGSNAQIGQALSVLGGNLDDVDHVILTHLHGDHVGGLPQLLEAAPGAQAYAGEADVAGITSPRPITAVSDGEDIFGLQVVATPGHTPGHICLYDEAASLLIAGDALAEASGAIDLVDDRFTDDKPMAIASAQQLGALSYETVLFGHGQPVLTGASALVASGFADR